MKQLPRGFRTAGRPQLTVRLLALSGAVATLTLAGCAAAPVASRTQTPVRASVAAVTKPGPPPATSPEPTIAPPAQRARTAAAVMLRAFAPPPGAREVPRSPVPGSPLSGSSQSVSSADNDVVTRTSWWLVPGDPQAVLAWATAHLPAQYHHIGGGTAGTGIWAAQFTLAAVPGLFDRRSFAVSVTSADHGQVAIRVDALVDWIPARPAGDTVPASARVATLVQTADKFGAPGGESATVIHRSTVTDPAKVAALARYLGGLPVDPPGGRTSCLMATSGLTVTFRARPGGPVLAQASAGLGGCDPLTYSMPGHTAIGLGGGPAGDNLFGELNRVTGQHWKIPQG